MEKLPIPDPEGELKYVMMRCVPFAMDSKVSATHRIYRYPWTLATYMVEGGSAKTFGKVKKMAFSEPKSMHLLLDKLQTPDSLSQRSGKAPALMVFDTWGVLSPSAYNEFSLQYMAKIVDASFVKMKVVRCPLLFTKNGGQWLEDIASGCDGVGLDWTTDIADAKRRVGDKVALQGNMDPCMLHAPAERIRQEVKTILDSFGKGNGHVFNLGHGIHPDIDPENAGVFINSVHEFSKR